VRWVGLVGLIGLIGLIGLFGLFGLFGLCVLGLGCCDCLLLQSNTTQHNHPNPN